jgi:hypothetical protein
VSLTRLLRGGKNPVHDWFAENFRETHSVCTDANRHLREGSTKEPCAVPLLPGADASLVGTAVGYLLSAHLCENALDATVATSSAQLLDRPLAGRIRFPPSLVERAVVERVRELHPWTGQQLDGQRWSELCQLVCILARFEQVFRAGAAVLHHLVPPLAEHGDNLGELAAALVEPPTLDDVGALGRATVEDLAHIREARELFIGPTFAQSLALGGADADLIYDGTLLDLKSTSQAGVVGRVEVWQLLGYLFADTDDAYHVQRVGFAALRRRRTFFWTGQELIDALAGKPSAQVGEWRHEFTQLLEPLAVGHTAY